MDTRRLTLTAAALAVAAGALALAWHGWTGGLVERLGAQDAEFAGEKALMDGQRALNRDKLERELVIGRYNAYQSLLYLKRAPRYFPEIERKLKAAGLPDDLKYLAVAESALKDDAGSDAGAAGIWQLMPDTARRYGLRVDSDVDERYHFGKATDAALRHLAKLRDLFGGSWALAAAAYNRGENGLARDMASQPGAATYWDLYLNPETGNYVYRIMAIKYLMRAGPSLFTAQEIAVGGREPVTSVEALGPVADLAAWAREKGLGYAQLRALNPWIRGDGLPEGTWTLATLAP